MQFRSHAPGRPSAQPAQCARVAAVVRIQLLAHRERALGAHLHHLQPRLSSGGLEAAGMHAWLRTQRGDGGSPAPLRHGSARSNGSGSGDAPGSAGSAARRKLTLAAPPWLMRFPSGRVASGRGAAKPQRSHRAPSSTAAAHSGGDSSQHASAAAPASAAVRKMSAESALGRPSTMSCADASASGSTSTPGAACSRAQRRACVPVAACAVISRYWLPRQNGGGPDDRKSSLGSGSDRSSV